MSRYYLSEAYADLYNPNKVDENFYANFRFIDNLLDEDIEEVVESVYWEFRDYGNTEQEAFDLIEYALSDEVLEESLMEATITSSDNRPNSSGSATVTSAAGRRRGRMTRVFAAKRKVERGIRSGVGAVKSAVAATGRFVSGEAQKAKAGLTKVLRTGARAAGSKIRQAGEKIEKSGKEAASAPAVTRSANIGGRRHTYVSEPTPETGRKRRAIGSTIKRIADRLIKSGAERTPLPPRTHLTSASRVPSTLPDPWYTQTKLASRPSTSSRPPAPTRKALPPGRSLGLRSLGKGGPSKEISFSRHAQKRVVPIGSNKKELEGSARDVSIRAARRRAQMAEELELITQKILDDLISEGYADNIDNAATILENLSDEVIENLISEYLN